MELRFLEVPGVIQKKLALLVQKVSLLEDRMKEVTFEQYAEDWVIRAMAERMIQVCVEIIIDIAERIISLENLGPVEGAAQSMEKLVGLGILPNAEPYTAMVRLRNLIVHEYDGIRPEILYPLLKNNLGDFLHFRNAIDRANA